MSIVWCSNKYKKKLREGWEFIGVYINFFSLEQAGKNRNKVAANTSIEIEKNRELHFWAGLSAVNCSLNFKIPG